MNIRFKTALIVLLFVAAFIIMIVYSRQIAENVAHMAQFVAELMLKRKV